MEMVQDLMAVEASTEVEEAEVEEEDEVVCKGVVEEDGSIALCQMEESSL